MSDNSLLTLVFWGLVFISMIVIGIHRFSSEISTYSSDEPSGSVQESQESQDFEEENPYTKYESYNRYEGDQYNGRFCELYHATSIGVVNHARRQ